MSSNEPRTVQVKHRSVAGWVLAVAGLLAACAQGGIREAIPESPQPAAVPARGAVERLRIPAEAFAPDAFSVSVHLPPGYAAGQSRYPVLYINDGQDMAAVGLESALARLYDQDIIRPIIVVAIGMLPDRMGTYGLSDRAAARSVPADSRFGPVGSRAHEYSEWVARELVPYVDARYRTHTRPSSRAVLGWSIGALNAFNLAWQYPEVFGRVGVFSPSFWLASDRTDAIAIQKTRLAQAMVDRGSARAGLKVWISVGGAEEADDRDGDGVSDAVDDARDLVAGYSASDGTRLRGLAQLGYSVNMDHAHRATRADVAFLLVSDGQHNQASWARMLPEFLTWAYRKQAPPLDATGQVRSYQEFDSRFVAARNVDVWLPPDYGHDTSKHYPVVYMHDGQNLFDPALSYTGIDWGVDETMTRLIREKKIREAIVVGIWNTPLRGAEYMPRKAVEDSRVRLMKDFPDLPREQILSDAYLKFLVEELKPFIDTTFRTLPARQHTFVMGSSMGGLISAYAISEYPDVFGGAAGVSTHWPAGDGVVIDYLREHLPDPRTHKFYFDYGTETLDAGYGPYQRRMDKVLRRAGYTRDINWITLKAAGAEHSERAWSRRVDQPLIFFLGY